MTVSHKNYFERFLGGILLQPIDSGPRTIDDDTTIDKEGALYVYSDTLKIYLEAALRTIATLDQTQTFTNKTLTSPVLNTGVAGTAVKDEDNMASDSATHLCTQQSIKAYVDTQLTAEDLDIAGDTGTGAVDLDSQSLTIAGGTGLDSVAGSQTVTLNIDSTVATLTGAQTLTNKALSDDTCSFGDSGDLTKKLEFELAGATTSKTATIVSSHTDDRSITLPDATDTLVGKATTDALTNKSIDSDNNTITNIVDADIKAGAAIDAAKLADGSVSNAELQRLASIGSTAVGISDAQTLTNKSIDSDNNTITNIVNADIKAAAAIDAAKIADGTVSSAEFQYINSLSSNAQTQLNAKEGTLTNSAGLAAAINDETGTGVVVFNDTPTIASPVLNTGVSGTAVKDEDDLVSDSNTHLCTQQSIKAYVDANTGGEGGINYVKNGKAELDASDTTDDTNIAITRNTTTPLRDAGDFLITKSAGGDYSTQKAKWDLDTFNNTDKASVIKVTFDYDFSDSDYADDDFGVVLYDNDESNAIECVPRGIKAGKGTYVGYFQSHATSTDYDLHIVNDVTDNSEVLGYIDNISVGPAQYSFGPVISDPEAFTPTLQDDQNVTTNEAHWVRRGNMMLIYGHLAWDGAGAGSAYVINIPNGFSIDTTVQSSVGGEPNGSAVWYDSGVGFVSLTPYVENSGFRFTENGTNNVWDGSQAANGDYIKYSIEVPILGWSSSQQMSDDADTRVVAAKYTYATADSIAHNTWTTIPYATEIKDTHNAVAAGVFTAPHSGFCFIAAAARLASDAGWEDGENVRLGVSIDGAATPAEVVARNEIHSTGAISLMVTGSTMIWLEAKQTIEVKINQGSDGPIALTPDDDFNTLSVFMLSGPSAIAANELVAARYDTDSGQTIANGDTDIIDYDSTTNGYDTHGCVTTGAAWKFTALISGKFNISPHIWLNGIAHTATDDVIMVVYKNGSEFARLDSDVIDAGVTRIIKLKGATDVPMNVGDYIDIRLTNNTGSTVTLGTSEERQFVSIHRLGF